MSKKQQKNDLLLEELGDVISEFSYWFESRSLDFATDEDREGLYRVYKREYYRRAHSGWRKGLATALYTFVQFITYLRRWRGDEKMAVVCEIKLKKLEKYMAVKYESFVISPWLLRSEVVALIYDLQVLYKKIYNRSRFTRWWAYIRVRLWIVKEWVCWRR